MEPPSDPALPLFAYGTLRPGEIAYFRIKSAVSRYRPAEACGALYVRDGLLVADQRGNSKVAGDVVEFMPAQAQNAYESICDLEPDKQYRWGRVRIEGIDANILWGKSATKGSKPVDFAWSSWNDPLFTTALDIVEEEMATYAPFTWDCKNSFHLQMAYLLLWTSIERYASLRYHLRADATAKVKGIASETAFSEKLAAVVSSERTVQRADKPEDRARLTADDANKSIEYYYQVRSNMVHRGKAMPHDHETVRASCCELLQIFRHVLDRAQQEARAIA